MRLPNADRAIIEREKLREYLLSRTHPVGRFKAAFFEALGYSAATWRQLEIDLRRQHLVRDAVPGHRSLYGQKYEIQASLVGPSGRRATVVSVWVVLSGDDVPRLVTAHPGGVR
jgi:hypothetical protein